MSTGHWTLPPGVDMPPMTADQRIRFQALLDWFALGLARAISIDHTMFHGNLTFRQGDEVVGKRCFMFMVIGEQAARAEELLRALPLCDTDLGAVPERTYTRPEEQPRPGGVAGHLKDGTPVYFGRTP